MISYNLLLCSSDDQEVKEISCLLRGTDQDGKRRIEAASLPLNTQTRIDLAKNSLICFPWTVDYTSGLETSDYLPATRNYHFILVNYA